MNTKQIMNIHKSEILNKICYTELVYGRINKKLNTTFSKSEIERLIFDLIDGVEEDTIQKVGKNYYIENQIHKVKITVNSNTFRIITVNKI